MPWSVKSHEGKFCIFKEGSDTPISGGCHATKEEADKHRKALYANMPEGEKMMMESYQLECGTTLVAVAATSKPHLRQRGADITLIEKDGKEMVRVPVARKGVYKHKLAPDGKLVLGDKEFDKMIENFDKEVTDFNVSLDLRHTDEKGALALLDKADGGQLVKEGDWLVAYGYPTRQHAKDLIQSKSFRYASAEIHPNYDSNLVHQLSSDDLEIYELEEEKGKTMSDVTISQEEYDRLKALEAKVVKLEANQKPEEIEIPEAFRLELETLKNEAKEAKRAILKSNVALAVSEMRNFRDDQGRGHSEAFINTVSALLLGEPVGEGEETIKLEATSSPITAEQVATYYRQGLLRLAKTTPGQVNMTTKTVPDEIKLEAGNGNLQWKTEEVTKFAKNAWQGFVPEGGLL